jgi:hypothetical protein
MKTRELFLIFALTSVLSLSAASTPHRFASSARDPFAMPSSFSAIHAGTMPMLGLLQDSAPPVRPAPEKKDVDVTVKTESRTWYVSPVWVAIGILAAIVLVLLISMAVRGGGVETTRIVHE